MLGAVAGDIIGSIYEARPIKSRDFPLFGAGTTFTDDSVCTLAIADCLMQGGDHAQYLRAYVRRYPDRGYGGMFARWAHTPGMPAYGSWGNGAAMRVSAIAWLARDEGEALAQAAASAAASHDHPDAIAGAQAIVLAMWLGRQSRSPHQIRDAIETRFGYDLASSIDDIRPHYGFDVSARGTVPPALIAALDADDYEDAVRGAVSLGGDADTLACIAGGLAEVLFGLPDNVAEEAKARLDEPLRAVVKRFQRSIAA